MHLEAQARMAADMAEAAKVRADRAKDVAYGNGHSPSGSEEAATAAADLQNRADAACRTANETGRKAVLSRPPSVHKSVPYSTGWSQVCDLMVGHKGTKAAVKKAMQPVLRAPSDGRMKRALTHRETVVKGNMQQLKDPAGEVYVALLVIFPRSRHFTMVLTRVCARASLFSRSISQNVAQTHHAE